MKHTISLSSLLLSLCCVVGSMTMFGAASSSSMRSEDGVYRAFIQDFYDYLLVWKTAKTDPQESMPGGIFQGLGAFGADESAVEYVNGVVENNATLEGLDKDFDAFVDVDNPVEDISDFNEVVKSKLEDPDSMFYKILYGRRDAQKVVELRRLLADFADEFGLPNPLTEEFWLFVAMSLKEAYDKNRLNQIMLDGLQKRHNEEYGLLRINEEQERVTQEIWANLIGEGDVRLKLFALLSNADSALYAVLNSGLGGPEAELLRSYLQEITEAPKEGAPVKTSQGAPVKTSQGAPVKTSPKTVAAAAATQKKLTAGEILRMKRAAQASAPVARSAAPVSTPIVAPTPKPTAPAAAAPRKMTAGEIFRMKQARQGR